jgi:hypothetical protein
VPEPNPTPSIETTADLAAVGAQVRAEWRADETMWMREAARRWAHARRIPDLLREYAARGDRVSVEVAGCTFDGMLDVVGDDRIDLLTPAGVINIHTAVSGSFGAASAPIAIRRSYRARAGGSRVPAALASFAARLRELEASGARVRVGTFLPVGELTGALVVGADHVGVRGDDEIVVPTAWIAYLAVSGASA